MPASIQQVKKVTVAAGGTLSVPLESNMPVDRLTIWAVTGTRKISMTFQPRVNGVSFGAATTIGAAAVAATTLYTSGGATKEDIIIPQPSAPAITTPPDQVPDPFVFDIFITNNDGVNAGTVTLYFCGYNHTGS
jgi:hypothetical protein